MTVSAAFRPKFCPEPRNIYLRFNDLRFTIYLRSMIYLRFNDLRLTIYLRCNPFSNLHLIIVREVFPIGEKGFSHRWEKPLYAGCRSNSPRCRHQNAGGVMKSKRITLCPNKSYLSDIFGTQNRLKPSPPLPAITQTVTC